MQNSFLIGKSRVKYIFIVASILLLFLLHTEFKSERVWWIESVDVYSDAQSIKVVTYNIQYGKGQDGQINLKRTIDTLKEIDADIISLQEIERYSLRSSFEDQVNTIAKELSMNGVFYPSIAYPGMYYGNAILSRFPINESFHLPLLSQHEDRSMVLVDIQLSDEQTVYVLNTHLGLDQEERARDIDTIYELLYTLDAAFILTGDLNSTPDQNEYAVWTDILNKSNKGRSIQSYYNREWQIDYIFHSYHFKVLNSSVVESKASDHFPVTAVLELR